MRRIDKINAIIAASTDANGKAKKGFKARVAACREALGKIEIARAMTSKDSGVDNPAP